MKRNLLFVIAAAITAAALIFASAFYNDKIIDRKKSYTSAAVYEDVKRLEDKYPNLISVSSAGKSSRGKDIPLIKLGRGDKKACIVAGLHSREHITVSFSLLCAEEYCRAYTSAGGKYGEYDMRKLLNKYTLYIVPMSNPDGMDVCNSNETPRTAVRLDRTLYKNNANNVNLNANFPFFWDSVSDKSRDKGESAASEIETKNLITLCEKNSFSWLLDMHIAGNCLFWRDAANGEIKDDYRLASALSDRCGYYLCPVTEDVNGYGGGFENWFRYKTGKPAVCVELVLKNGVTEGMSLADYNKNFDTALDWNKTRFTFAAAMSA